MKLQNCLIAFVLLFTCATSRAAEDEHTLWAYKHLLATATNFHEVAPVLRRFDVNDELRDQDLLDLIAELVVTRTPVNKQETYARDRSVRVLADSGNPRYYSLLLKIAVEKTDDRARQYAREAVGGKKRPDVEQYRAGMANVDVLRDEYARAALAVEPTNEAAVHLSKLQKGATLAQVIEHAGKPQGVSARIRRSPDPIMGTEYLRIALYYRGVGRVWLQYHNDRGWLVRTVVAAPLAFEDFMPYRMDPVKYGQPDDNVLALIMAVSNDRGALRRMLDQSEHYDTTSLELLDTVAERLLQEHALADPPLTRDLYNWMCVLLTHEGGTRYSDVLAAVANTTADEKTRAFATEKIDATKNKGAPAYVPGTLSLDAQRKKYPSLYPQRTFYFGRP